MVFSLSHCMMYIRVLYSEINYSEINFCDKYKAEVSRY